MRNTLLLIFVFVVVAMADVSAQYTIKDSIIAKPLVYTNDTPILEQTTFKSVNEGWLKHEKKLVRHEKNYFETKTGITFNQFAYMNWSGGGESSYNGKFTSLNTHAYHDDKLTVDSYFNVSLGLGEKGGELWKTEDKLELNTIVNYQMWGKWTYSLGVNFATQFANGYGSEEDRLAGNYSSKFFAPATLKPFIGISYRHSDNQIVTIAPISGNLLFVMDETLSNAGAFGVKPGERFKPTLGSYINVQWKQNIDRKGILVYKTSTQIFCDYISAPVVGWENWIDLTVFEYLTVGLYFNVVYNNQIAPQAGSNTFWQIKESLGIGVSYNFRNKDNKPDNSNFNKQFDFNY